MSAKRVLNYDLVTNQSGATAFDTFGGPSSANKPAGIHGTDNGGILIYWTGDLIGELKVYVSNDVLINTLVPINWSKLEFGTPIILDSTNSDMVINMNQMPFSWLAITYTPTSGTGNITAKLVQKIVGA